MSWFKRENGEFPASGNAGAEGNDDERRVRTEGLWSKCPGCRETPG